MPQPIGHPFFPHLLLSPFRRLSLLSLTLSLSSPKQPGTAFAFLSKAGTSVRSWEQGKDAMNSPGLRATDQAMHRQWG